LPSDDRGAAVRRHRVRDGDEAGGEVAVGVEEREVALVGPHGGGEHLGREAHRVLVDRAHERDGPLDEAFQLVEQALVGLHGQALALGEAGGALRDQAAAVGAVEEDLRGLQLRLVVGEVADADRAGRHEAVAEGDVAALDRAEAERDDGAVEQADDRVEGADPAGVARAPAHRLGPGKAGEHVRQDGGQHLGRGAAALLDKGVERPALLLLALF
jgi:hypothetical protein